MLRQSFVDDSGGLGYHWRALRYRRTLWQDFAAQVARWLAAWRPPQRDLVIVGPSAGYTLARAFLERFASVTILEPDPFARLLLRRRFPFIPFMSGSLDCMAGAEGPYLLAATYPQAAILFANVIGQKIAALPPAWAPALHNALREHSWASYHDVIATTRMPRMASACTFDANARLEDVLETFWGGDELVIHDHGSFGVLPSHEFTTWQITPQQCQLVGWSSIIVVGSSAAMPGNSGMGGRS